MNINLKRLYDNILKIYEEEAAYLIDELADLILKEEAADENMGLDDSIDLERQKSRRFISAALAVVLAYLWNELYGEITESVDDYNDLIRQSINHVEAYARWNVNDDNELYSAVADLGGAFSNSVKDDIIGECFCRKNDFVFVEDYLSEFSCYFVTRTAVYLSEIGYDELAEKVLLHICELAEERLQGDIEQFRDLIITMMLSLLDAHQDMYIVLYEKYTSIIEKIKDEDLADIHWAAAGIYETLDNIEKGSTAFEKCYEVREIIYGIDDWYTQMARRGSAIMHAKIQLDRKDCEVLSDFAARCRRGDFIEDVESKDLLIIEGISLYCILGYKTKWRELDFVEVNRYYEIAEKYNDDITTPYLNLKSACNWMGIYFFMDEDYIQAEVWLKKAIDVRLQYEETISDDEIRVTLLMTYNASNDIYKALELFESFSFNHERRIEHLAKKQELVVWNIMCGIWLRLDDFVLDDEQASFMKSVICELKSLISENKDKGDWPDHTEILIMVAINFMFYLVDHEEELSSYQDLLENIYDLSDELKYTHEIAFILNSALALVTNNVKYVNYVLNHIEDERLGWFVRIVHGIEMVKIIQKSDDKIAILYIKKLLAGVENIWHRSVRYIDDNKLLAIISRLDLPMLSCYSIVRDCTDLDESYEYLLRFKALASLAGRERNKVLRLTRPESELISRIHLLQNKIAEYKAIDVISESDNQYKKYQDELTSLEYEFAKIFPSISNFTTISGDLVKQAVPDNCAVMEFYPYRGKYETDCDDFLMIDVYLIIKRNGFSELKRRSITDAINVYNKAEEYVKICHRESTQISTVDDIDAKYELNQFLYERLIEPDLAEMTDIKTIYIAPEGELTNLAFGLLCDSNGVRLGDKHYIVTIECARDFLFINSGGYGDESLVIGNPLYRISGQGKKNLNDGIDNHRYLRDIYKDIQPLPFSELEAMIVSRLCGCTYYSGINASKQLVLNAVNKRIIHLATHGLYDITGESDSLFSAQLLFSGAADFDNMENVHGSGIITADEISRLDLRKTELVVLSACLSGRSDSYYVKEFQGLLSAFASAGVKYIISSLWLANDFATMILMNSLYYAYIKKSMKPYIALHYAKTYLRNITVGQIKKSGYIEYALKNLEMNNNTKNALNDLCSRNDNYKPFKNEIYWGGFICNQCY